MPEGTQSLTGIVDGQAAPSPSNCASSAAPSPGSKRRWPVPKSARDVAAQANLVATLVLNGDLSLEHGRVYASTARLVAQALTVELSRARLSDNVPDLSLDYATEEAP